MENEQIKIVIIDDDNGMRDVFQKYLSRIGYFTFVAENGKEGIEIIQKEKPDLIITDLRMPVLSGLDVVKYINENSPEVPVIIVSGTIDIKDVINTLRMGAWDYIIKPIMNFDIIKHSVEKSLERAKLLLENKKYRENLEEQVKIRTREFEEELAARIETERLLNDSIKRLNIIMNGTIETIGKIGEMRDPYTTGHMKNVAVIAQEIARELGLGEEVARAVYVAGLLHDIGKISIPLDILSKPGKISSIEKEMIKTHAIAGHDILSGIEFQWDIARIVEQHHERNDGSGYPNGIKDSEIMIEAKIIAVADVVEAIASHRPYRPSLGLEAAIEEIQKWRGIVYEPNVVDACISLIRNGKLTIFDEIKNQ